jgi:SAM-dependent methyltransferase
VQTVQDAAALAAQYGSDENLRVRIETHHRYTVGGELEPAVDVALALSGDEILLDAGTGPGDFPGRLRQSGHRGRLVGADLSTGMIERGASAYPTVGFVVADVRALPFADATFDVVTARHMLYHVPDVGAALTEMRRVLKPGGRFLAVTNARGYMGEYWRAVAEAVRHWPEFTPLADRAKAGWDDGFTEVSGETAVRAAFGNAAVSFSDAALVFDEVAPVLAYFDSARTMYPMPAPVWDQGRSALRRIITARLEREETWRVSKRVALIAASR